MKRLRIPGICLALAALTASAPALSARTVTVGDFVREIAALRSLPSDTPAVALDALRDSGVDVSTRSLDSTLTEHDVASIVSALGVRVSTSRPDRPFGREELDRFFVTMTSELGPDTTGESADRDGPYPRPNDRAADPATKGKGKKKGLPVSPSSPM